MGKPFKCALVGGDGRQILLGRFLEEEGFPVRRFALPEGEKHLEGALAEAGCVLLPLPVEREGLLNAPLWEHKWPMEKILEAIPRGTLVLGGQVSARLKKLGEQQGLRLVDYGAREDFLCRNAAITAEGALQLAMGHHQESLGDTRCLVLGYGRCGKALCRALSGITRPWVWARRPEVRAQARAEGLLAPDTLMEGLKGAGVIFNTVPALLIGENQAGLLEKDSLYVELAGNPGGAGFFVQGSFQTGGKCGTVKDRRSLLLSRKGKFRHAENKP